MSAFTFNHPLPDEVLHPRPNTAAEEGLHPLNAASDSQAVASPDKGPSSAELLRRKYGPHAKIVVRRVPAEQQRAKRAFHLAPGPQLDDLPEATVSVNPTASSAKQAQGLTVDDVDEEEVVAEGEPVAARVPSTGGSQSPPGSTGQAFPDDPAASTATLGTPASSVEALEGQWINRASATFRLLGFPVELASCTAGTAAEAEELAFQCAMDSDVVFIAPNAVPDHVHGPARWGNSRDRNREGGKNRGNRQRGSRRQSNAPTLSPRQMEMKAILDELRELCTHFCRILKFSIKPTSKGARGGAAGAPKWRCRAYMRDEWGVASSLYFIQETEGSTQNDALLRCFATLRDRFKEELYSDGVLLESVREVQAVLGEFGMSVTGDCVESDGTAGDAPGANKWNQRRRSEKKRKLAEEATDAGEVAPSEPEPVALEEQYLISQTTVYTSTIVVEDAYGNVSLTQMKKQPTPLAGYEAASWQAIRTERAIASNVTITDECVPLPPLLLRLRWQLELMAQHISACSGENTAPADIARIIVESNLSMDSAAAAVSEQQPAGADGGETIPVDRVEPAPVDAGNTFPYYFTASFVSEGQIVSQTNGLGRYRVEFDCYVQAVTYLLDQYPDIALAHCKHLFPTARMLELAVWRHDNLNILTTHKGKWNCYAVLGTLTSNLIGSFYQTSYRDDGPNTTQAILTVNDGIESSKLLIARQAGKRGEAWRNACLAAMVENFPRQYADAAAAHPDLDLSRDTMARGSKYRALPREKRVRHMNNLFSLVAAFGEEDMGWTQMRIRLRNCSGELGLPMWVGEMEAQVEGEDERRVIFVTPPYSQSRQARRVLIYQLAERFFPVELKAYRDAGRSDANNPDADFSYGKYTQYKPGLAPFATQVIQLIEKKQPSLAPLSWTLERHYTTESDRFDNDGSVEYLIQPLSLQYRASICAQMGESLLSERVGEIGESPVNVLRSVLKAVSEAYGGPEGEALWSEYETHMPPPLSTSRDLVMYLFNSFFGISATGDVRTVEATSETPLLDAEATNVGDFWFATVTMPRCGSIVVSRALERTKKDAVRDALILACRENFSRQLHFFAKQEETCTFAEDIIGAPTVSTPSDAVVADIRAVVARNLRLSKPTPYRLLTQCVNRDYKHDRVLRVELSTQTGGRGYVCRICLQNKRLEVRKGEVQIVGYATALGRNQALHLASVMALGNLFETELSEMLHADPTYADMPLLNQVGL